MKTMRPAQAVCRVVGGFDALARAVATAGAVCGAVLLLAMVGHVILEIVLRTFFATSTFVLDEFVGYGVAAVTFLCAGYAFQEGALIRVGIVLEASEPIAGLRRGIEIACAVVGAAIVWFVTWYFCLSVWRHVLRGNRSETIAQVPLWIPEGLMLLGLAILGLRLSAYALRVTVGGALLGPEGAGDGAADQPGHARFEKIAEGA